MELKGLGVAMVTPFKVDLSIDFKALEKLTNDLIEGGVDFLVVLGTTGEAPTLSSEEKENVLNKVLEFNSNRVPVVYGMGGNNTAALCEELKKFKTKGVSAFLSASPSYNKPTQEGIYRHYVALGEVSPLPIILYNVPGRTGSNVEADTCIRIANDVDKVVAVKEASGDLDQIIEIINRAPVGFDVYSGDDSVTVPVIEAGGKGVISVLGNALPELCSQIVNTALSESFKEANVLDLEAQRFLPLLFREGNPAGIKCMQNILTDFSDVVRLPLVSASSELREDMILAVSEMSEMV